MPSGYLLGIGSNVAPEQNVPAVLKALLAISPQLYLSRVVRTAPEGMQSAHDFLNVVVLVTSDLSPEALKQQTNRIEEALGRDRSAPDRKTRDRPADIDLLTRIRNARRTQLPMIKENYLRPLAEELLDYLQNRPLRAPNGVVTPIHLDGLSLGEMPATVSLDTATGVIGLGEPSGRLREQS
ncbi:2-amino-4-hydroxy-6-hydroxymethyldihydropteridine diphosphokinase [Permianibacter sp. IMCC34836]|uniref:2-amino-4-hydroxy-6- hydroxymethyldihydropteridine diphosphokinase n=1 Tax=Permianibacter fluminis TaxID=2738515 RepID=UPI0015568B03|nr:2-amino-4-hydroxy-6-hydroxymethyldihydropteridine diphosphokinase [Permianibacter fluminis]NQD36406.1 2-amino-4-hydroxy-6-hydroxymethyldihydropteridine diphosphokinase [Permianibacter fluminis]